MSAHKAKRDVKKAAQRTLERALVEERLALSAITKVMLLEVPDPARVLARLDAMTRAAEANPRVSAGTRKRLIDATRFVRAAVERELGVKPQAELFDPPGREVKPQAIDALVTPTDGPQQLGLEMTESLLGDVETAHADRVQTLSLIHEALIEMLRTGGAATDKELHERYLRRPNGLPPQSQGAVASRRRELYAAGRIVKAGTRGSAPTWDVIERDALAQAS